MAERDVIREFLVSLGFEVDLPSAKKFGDSLKSVTSLAKLAGQAVIGVAVAAEAMVGVFAKQLENLYYAGKRTKSTVSELQSLRYASEQIGVSADTAQGTLEGMQQAMRTNPGMRNLLNNLVGHDTSRESGVKQMMELVQALGKMPHYQGAQFASMFGMDEKTFLMMKEGAPEMLRKMAEQQERLRKAGLSGEDGQVWHDYLNILRDIETELDIAGQKIATMLLPYVQELTVWIKDVLEYWTNFTESLTSDDLGSAGKMVNDISDDFKEFWGQIKESLHFLDEINTKFHVLQIVVTSVGKILTFVFSEISALGHEALAIFNAVTATVSGDWGGAKKALGDMAKYGQQEIDGLVNLFTGKHSAGAPVQSNSSGAAVSAPSGGPTGGGGTTPLGLRQNNPGNLRSWGGADKANGFAKFGSMQEGLSAMAGQLIRYGQRGWDTISSIVSHYAPSSENNTAAYIDQVSKRMGLGTGQHLNLGDPNTLARLMQAMIKQEQGQVPVGAQDLLATAQGKLAQKGFQLQQTNNITVNGAGDAHATAKAVGDQMKRTNGDLARNFGGAMA